MNQERVYYLLEQHYHRRITNEENRELAAYIASDDDQALMEGLSELMRRNLIPPAALTSLETLQPHVDRILAIDKSAGRPQFARRRIYYRWAGWAAALLLIAISVYLFYRPTALKKDKTVLAKNIDIAPGKNGAILTLSDGTQLVLDSLGNGIVKKQDGAVIEIANGQVHYLSAPSGTAAPVYNTITTPRGRQYQVVLADGTKVWLNAASSITYPVAFTGGERTVSILGEAYFEVSKMQNRPFNVQVNNGATLIKVLGTHFNINAYSDEPVIKTTLLEGAIKITAQGQFRLLKPGQQALTKSGSGEISIEKADGASAIAWKDHYFSFNNAGLQAVMREMARWYDLTVVYRGRVPEGRFSGKIGKDLTLRQVLNLLETTKIRYRIRPGNKIEIGSP